MFTAKSLASSLATNGQPFAQQAAAHEANCSIINEWLTMRGDLESQGDILVKGKVHGNITCKMLIVDTDAMVDGVINADDVVIRGVTRGIIRARRVRLESTAEVDGEVFHDMFAAEEGAKVRGVLRDLVDGQAGVLPVGLANAPTVLQPNLSTPSPSVPANAFYQRLDAARAAHATPQSPSR
ncbi:MAG: polymer-forming cytoskeletal protein [Hyphomicrobium sp.]|nr:polymer-forming cytoskeletal protein [Hyphomicrobium sp.]